MFNILKQKKRFVFLIAAASLFTLVFGFIINKITDHYFFKDTQNSFQSKKFAEAYGGSCNFATDYNGVNAINNITSLYPQWNSGYNTVSIPEGSTSNVTLPFDFKFAGKYANTIGINKDSIENTSNQISYYTNIYPNYQSTGLNDKIELYTNGLNLTTVPYNVIQDANSGGPGDYYVRRRDNVKTKMFNDGTKNVFGMKFEYYTPENAPFEAVETDVQSYAHTPVDIYPQDHIADVNGDTVHLTSTFSQPSHGTVTYNSSADKYVYTPSGTYYGSDSFTFQAIANGDTVSGIVNLQVTGVHTNYDQWRASTGLHSIPVLGNDYYYAGGDYTLSIVSQPTDGYGPWGSATVNNNEIDFDVPDNNSGYLIYQLTDNSTGESEQQTLYVNAYGDGDDLTDFSLYRNYYNINNPASDYDYISVGGTVKLHPLQNDGIYESGPTTLQLTSNPAYGSPLSAFTVNSDNSLSVDTTQLTSSYEQLLYQVNTANGQSYQGQIFVYAITPVEYSQYVYLVDKSYDVLNYEVVDKRSAYHNASLNYNFATPPILSYYDTSFNDNVYGYGNYNFYQPGQSYNQLNYAMAQTNCSPYAADDTVSVPNGGTSNINVLGNIFTSPYYLTNGSNNGSDYDYEYLRSPTDSPIGNVEVLSDPDHGTYTILPNNRIAYTPTPGYTGSDYMYYRYQDSSTRDVSQGDNSRYAYGSVTIDVYDGPDPGNGGGGNASCGSATSGGTALTTYTAVCLNITAGVATIYAGDKINDNDICAPADDGQVIEGVTCSDDERSIDLTSKNVVSTRQESASSIYDIVLDDLRGLQAAQYAVDVTMCNLNGDTNNDNQYDDITYPLGYTQDANQPLYARFDSNTYGVVSALKPASTVNLFEQGQNLNWSKGTNTSVTDVYSAIPVFYTESEIKPGRYEVDNSQMAFQLPAYIKTGKYRCNVTYTLTL